MKVKRKRIQVRDRPAPLGLLIAVGGGALVLILHLYLAFQVTSKGHFLRKSTISTRVHAFYYPWYGNPSNNGEYQHWNHPLLPHWNKAIARRYPTGRHNPDLNDLGSSFYPQLGAYSSTDPNVVDQHFVWMKQAGIGVAVVSWLPGGLHDDNGPPLANRLELLLEKAQQHGMYIAIHMEPYENRSPQSVRKDLEQLLQAHGDSPALFRIARPGGGNKLLPLIYVYDQYRVPAIEWKELLMGSDSIRGTELDCVILALIVEESHWDEFCNVAGFDGGYTYFAANTFTYGSRLENWSKLQALARKDGKIFCPSVGPGYDDTRVRPWNGANTNERRSGAYFDLDWEKAAQLNTQFVSITSFNEWHEGTQIEPAIPQVSADGFEYKDYQDEGGPEAYLQQTRRWVERLTKR